MIRHALRHIRLGVSFRRLFISVAILGASSGAVATTPGETANQIGLAKEYGKLPIAFEANQGQTDTSVKFLARGQGYALFLTPTEAVFSLRTATVDPETRSQDHLANPITTPKSDTADNTVVRMKLVGANKSPTLTGLDTLPGKSNYFIGNDQAKWQRDVPNYAKVKYSGVYPGIDLVYYGNQRQLEYDFIVAPGAE